jgi:hypothetical protein
MTIAYILLAVYLLWLFYLAVMSLFRARANGTLSLPAKVLGYPILIVGVLLDALVNLTVLTIVFAERPYEWLVTKRLTRHGKYGGGWRRTVANWICSHLLNPFDPDQRGHCR